MGRPDFTALAIAGDGAYDAYIDLDQVPHARSNRYDNSEPIRQAVTLNGADLDGGLRDGRSIYEINSYAPPGVVEDDGDRCLLASLEFHSVVLTSAWNGVLNLKGFLSAADTYSQDIHDVIAGGTVLETIPELESDGGVRYLPPVHAPLQDFLGWEASIRLVPRKTN